MKSIYLLVLLFVVVFAHGGQAKSFGQQTDTVHAKSVYVLSQPYPNPVSNILIFNYKIPQQTKSSSIHFYDLTGRKVSQVELEGFSGQVKMNLENYSNGIYFYTLYLDGKATKTGRFVKKQV